MTVEEAIAKFQRTSVLWKSASNTEMIEAVKTAITALEENLQYKAIGLGSPYEVELDLLLYKADREALREYDAIGTVEELRELKEKATAKKPVEKTDNDGYVEFYCPNCDAHLFFDDEQKFCNECGQALEEY